MIYIEAIDRIVAMCIFLLLAYLIYIVNRHMGKYLSKLAMPQHKIKASNRKIDEVRSDLKGMDLESQLRALQASMGNDLLVTCLVEADSVGIVSCKLPFTEDDTK